MWQINGCDVLNNKHVFQWSGSTTDPAPIGDVNCNCGAFIMKAHTGEVVPSEEICRIWKDAHAILRGE
jgi:hypothetical protein